MASKYSNSDDLLKEAEKYFLQYPHPDDFELEEDKEKALKRIQNGMMPTLNGLVLKLGFANIQSLYDYKEKKGFSKVLEQIRTRLASYYELNLNSKFGVNAFNWLKSVQSDIWKDKDTAQAQALPIVANIVFIEKDGDKKQIKTIDAQYTEVAPSPLLPSKNKELTQATKPRQASKPKSKAKAKARAKK